jgi:hypothetical protein
MASAKVGSLPTSDGAEVKQTRLETLVATAAKSSKCWTPSRPADVVIVTRIDRLARSLRPVRHRQANRR